MEGPEVVNSPPPGHHESQITLRYWAGARHAALVVQSPDLLPA